MAGNGEFEVTSNLAKHHSTVIARMTRHHLTFFDDSMRLYCDAAC